MKTCVLCNLIEEKSQTLWENSDFIVMFNRYPYKLGHIMIVPKYHTSRLSRLNKEKRFELIELISQVSDILLDFFETESINHGINQGPNSGASIPEHIHYHLIPRKFNDTGFFTLISKDKAFRYTDQDKTEIFGKLSEILSKKIDYKIKN